MIGSIPQSRTISASAGMFDFSSRRGLSRLLLGLDLLGSELRFRGDKRHPPLVDLPWVRIGGHLGFGAELHLSQVGFVYVPAQPGMVDVAHRHHRGSRRQHLSHVRRLHQHHAIHRRDGDGVGKLRIDHGEARRGARNLRSPRGQVLFAPLHFERVRLRHLHRGAGPLHLPLLRFDHLRARPGQHQGFALSHRFQRGLGALPAVAVLVELRRGNVVVLVQRLGAVPIPLGAVELRLRRIHRGPGVELFLRPRPVVQFRQARLVGRQVGLPLLDVGRQVGLLPRQRRLRLRQLRLGRFEARHLTLALRHQLIAVKPRDDLPLLGAVAFIHGALDEPPGGLERDVDFRQLDVSGDHDAAGLVAPHPAEHVHRRRPRRRQHYENQNDSLLHHCTMLLTLPIACARSIRATL
ncbi:MAG: hypothetical protein ABSG26_10615 [Bryobacteraceae bacterium]